jgi:16S rRNA (guanine527-N7)-methyltransferase
MNLAQYLDRAEITMHTEQIIQLEQFSELLQSWNQIHNLTGAQTLEAIYENIIDSLYPVTFIEMPASLLDVGTGAGFPGLVLAVAYPQIEVLLCEPRNKRAAFLKFAAMELGLTQVSVAKIRVEALEHEAFGMISSRAVTDTQLLLDITAHLSDAQTDYLFYKGSQVFAELEATKNQLNYDIVSKEKRNYLWIRQ